MSLKYNLIEQLAACKFNKELMVIVEGKDDYPIYQNIASTVNPQIIVYQVNEFADYEAGCRGVIKCLERLQTEFDKNSNDVSKVLGIIDRDIRPYRNEMPNLKGLYVLKHYSIETYFATRKNLRKLISKISFLPIDNIDNSVIDYAENNFQVSIGKLYLCSLEALKNACTENYDSVIGYDTSIEQILRDKTILTSISSKKAELEAFGEDFSISILDIKLIAKGKWYLYWFLNHTYPNIKMLKKECYTAHITQCRSCKVGNYNDCLYELKQNTYNINQLQDDLLTFIDEKECEDIIDRLQKLS